MPIDQIQAPLWSRMMENIPGISASVGFGTFRGSNTLLRGGYMDRPSRLGSFVNNRRASKFRFMQEGQLSSARASHYLIGGEQKVGKKMAFFRSSRLNNASLRPRAFGRFHSVSVFAGTAENAYTPFGASGFLGNTKAGRSLLEKSGIKLSEGEAAFGPGLLSAISAGRKVDIMEAKALKGSSRAARRLAKSDTALTNLAKMNNDMLLKPKIIQGTTTGPTLKEANKLRWAQRGAMDPSQYMEFNKVTSISYGDSVMKTALSSGEVGVRGNLYASSMSGAFTSYAAGYTRGALGFGGTGGLTGRALEGARAAETRFGSAFAKAFGDEGLTTRLGGKLFKGAEGGIELLQGTGGKALFRELGTEGITKLAASGGGRVLAARGLAVAIPGLQVLAAASFAYDIGKMAGEVVKSGINLAKDANRSLQGSIAKPAFGMGYKDTEAAATSRARGVQAIQNSRLNARSALGTEGAMMAAHYG